MKKKKNEKVICPVRNIELFSMDDCYNCGLREKTLLSADGKKPCQYLNEIEDKLIEKEVKADILKYGIKEFVRRMDVLIMKEK